MNSKNGLLLRWVVLSVICCATLAARGLADPNDPPPPPAPGDQGAGPGGPNSNGNSGGPNSGNPPPPPAVGRALSTLHLTDDQASKVDPIVQEFREAQEKARDDFLQKMKAVLTPDQFEQFKEQMMRRAPRPGQPKDAPPPPPQLPPPQNTNDGAGAPATQPAVDADPSHVPLTITGGHETDPRDHGRPVVLVAAGLNVPSDVFRQAFTKVKPAGPGQEPEEAQVRLNKQALMSALGPYGVTDDKLNEVSNYYRYSGSRGQMWKTVAATGFATFDHRVVKSITITNPGSGYSSPPQIAVPGANGQTFIASLVFGTDLSENGSIEKVTITPASDGAR